MTICSNPDCNHPIPPYVTRCPVCQTDAGFPNVRAAERKEETAALESRYVQALKEADSRGVSNTVDEFENSLVNSQAVLCKAIREVSNISSRDDHTFVSYHQLVSVGGRIPTASKWDRIREPAESLLFPVYFRDIQYAALSLNNLGPSGYGKCSITLQPSSIEKRASLLEQNSITFVTDRKLSPESTLPVGYRATWHSRGKLAVAKLATSLKDTTKQEEFPGILLEDTSATDCSLIEVQIFGQIHPQAIAHIVIRGLSAKAEHIFADDIRESMASRSVAVDVL